MIRKLLLAAFLIIGFSNVALAQNTQCPDRPPSSDDNSCANTRWVKANAGGGTPGGTNGQIQYNNSGVFGGFTATGDATINTATGQVVLSTVNANPGTFGSTTQCVTLTTNGKGLITAISQAACLGTVSSVSITAGTGITQSGSPITTSGAITVNVDKATTANIWGATSNKVATTDNVYGAAGALQAATGCGTATVTPSFTSGMNFSCQLVTATNFTLANPTLTSAMVGRQGCIFFTQPASGTVVTISYGTLWFASGGSTTQVLTATLSAQDVLCYFIVSTSEIWFSIANAVAH